MNLRKIVTLVVVVLLVGGTLYAKSLKNQGESEPISDKPSSELPVLLDLAAAG